MAIIVQFTTDPTLIEISEKHHAWHMYPGGSHGHPSRSIQAGQPGSGTEFFQFHKQLLDEFLAWNNVHHAAAAADIAAWNSIPAELKVAATGWPTPWPGLDLADAEAKINANPGSFTSEDSFGIHVESTVHNWIHGGVANCPAFALPTAEKTIISGFHSVQSTWFYRIHGLVQYWRERWVSQHMVKSVIKEIHDHGKHLTKEVDKLLAKEHVKELKEFAKEHTKEQLKDVGKEHGKEFKDKDKDLVEVFDPAIREELAWLKQRLSHLETTLVKGQAFIRPAERPAVGQAVVKPKKSH